jgi:hypothetical protein
MLDTLANTHTHAHTHTPLNTTHQVFDVLLRRFDCRTECFASPLNCRYGRFCSAFYDTDGAFGSLGSFFDFHPTEVRGRCNE